MVWRQVVLGQKVRSQDALLYVSYDEFELEGVTSYSDRLKNISVSIDLGSVGGPKFDSRRTLEALTRSWRDE